MRKGQGEIMENNLTLDNLQERLWAWQCAKWSKESRRAEILRWGVLEEFGEMMRPLVKRAQGIRGYQNPEKFKAEFGDAVADMTIYLLNLCSARGFVLDLTPRIYTRLRDRNLIIDRLLKHFLTPVHHRQEIRDGLHSLCLIEGIDYNAVLLKTAGEVLQRPGEAEKEDNR